MSRQGELRSESASKATNVCDGKMKGLGFDEETGSNANEYEQGDYILEGRTAEAPPVADEARR